MSIKKRKNFARCAASGFVASAHPPQLIQNRLMICCLFLFLSHMIEDFVENAGLEVLVQ